MRRFLLPVLIFLSVALPAAAADAVRERLDAYRAAGAGEFSAARGEAMWTRQQGARAPDRAESCATCHTPNLTQPGEHFRTGKPIAPLAPSVNAERLTDTAKMEKWFLRNCKGTWGRECTPQEKGDFLTYMKAQ
ncbi:MAG: DUF1924 domain-containing protein [Gammaproteobacteria bacterium]|nr:DUF1924 domain-containing protein [Gammaproteobacteria bacterium]MCW9058045.1 DUF1924 domain-containing protein [Gammaproteobacteria bacterium]